MPHPDLTLPSLPRWEFPTDLDTPQVVVDVDRLDRNVAAMAGALAARGVALRPHAKTHKSVEVARRQLAAGAAGITVATVGEAEVFAAAGVDDLFVAYPVWAAGAKAERLRRLAGRVRRLRVGADSPEGARLLGAALAGTAAEVLVEVDSGGARTGVADPAAAAAVADAAAGAGLPVVGVFTHGGHSYAAPGAGAAAADGEVRALDAAARALAAAGHPVEVRSAGSTPTALLSARDGVTEERPGTYVFGDRQQVRLGAHPPEDVALVVVTTVVSVSGGRAVLDAGAKTLAKDLPATVEGYGLLPAYPAATITRLYDHHAVVEPGDGPLPRLGEVLAVVPNHVCPVVNLATELVAVSSGRTVGRWPVDARARSG
jgi:D-serine deaminase-like pyridoxal phosphate-dependent protein